MKKNILLLVLSLSMISTSGFSQNRSIEFNHDSWSTILALAKKENKMIKFDTSVL